MKKVINSKRYDTDTAKLIAESEQGCFSDLEYICETLYKKRGGEYFLHGYGHAASKYADFLGDNRWGSGERIIPLSYEDARKWAEVNMDNDEYEREFGLAEDDGTYTTITCRVPSHLKAALDRQCSLTGKTQMDVIIELLSTLS